MPTLAKLKVCYLAGTLGQGGAERQLFYAVQALIQGGAAVRVLSFGQGEFWETPIKKLGAAVKSVGAGGSRLSRLFRIIKELKNDPADILQAQHFYTNAYVSLAAAALRSTSIGALRSNGRFELRESGRIGGRINLRLPRVLAANSQCSIRYAIALGVPASRLHFLPNVVDTERFKPAARPPAGPATLLAVGRLTREKRFDRFLLLLHQLRHEHHLNVRGLIVGPTRADQDLRPELEQQAAAYGLLPDGVQFLGSIADMPAIYQQATMAVLTSEHEGTPNALLEAMAAGLPVVATKVGGVPDVVQHGVTGFLVVDEDSRGLLGAALELVQNSSLRTEMGARARAYVQGTHSVHHLPVYLQRLYDFAGSGKPRMNAEGHGFRVPGLVKNGPM